MINVIKTGIDDLYVIEPKIHEDSRGYFIEIYNQKELNEVGLNMIFIQENLSVSKKGVLRGMHYQKDFPQGKLIRVIHGAIYDVVIDMRENSKTYRQWYGIELNDINNKQLYVPYGFAHGFYVLSDIAKVNYKVTDYWHPKDEIGIPWNDPTINIKWPIPNDCKPIIAEKDNNYNPIDERIK